MFAQGRECEGKAAGKLTLEDFALDEQGLVVRCPMGQIAGGNKRCGGSLQVPFDPAVCAGCPRKGDCPAAISAENAAGDTRTTEYGHEGDVFKMPAKSFANAIAVSRGRGDHVTIQTPDGHGTPANSWRCENDPSGWPSPLKLLHSV